MYFYILEAHSSPPTPFRHGRRNEGPCLVTGSHRPCSLAWCDPVVFEHVTEAACTFDSFSLS